MSLRVVRLAAGSFLQDEGRSGWRRYGVPPGGAFDRESHRLALALVGRTQGSTLEIPLMGGAFSVDTDSLLAIVGAVGPVQVDGSSVRTPASFRCVAGSKLEIGPTTRGVRTYLASAYGFRADPVLGSVSNLLPAELAAEGPAPSGGIPCRLEPPTSLEKGPLRFVDGPQARLSDLESLESVRFKVELASNRQGIRMSGGQFESAEEFASEPCCLGAVQLTPSGGLVVHGPDGPTIGGYPKIAVVVDADLDRLAQLAPEAEIEFQRVTMEEARRLSAARLDRLRQTLLMVRERIAANPEGECSLLPEK